MFRRWIEGILQGALATVLLALLPLAAVTYLARIRSEWTAPILLGLSAGALVSVIFAAINATRRLPPQRVVPDLENVEVLVRLWLNNFRIGVKNDPIPETYFRVSATMDGGARMIVGRPRGEFNGYILIRSDITATPDEVRVMEALGEEKVNQILLEIKLELARAKVGYGNLVFPVTNFYILKRMPINEHLSEDVLIAKMEEVEAALLAVAAVFLMHVNPGDASPLRQIAPSAS
jgi:hypothetical protein